MCTRIISRACMTWCKTVFRPRLRPCVQIGFVCFSLGILLTQAPSKVGPPPSSPASHFLVSLPLPFPVSASSTLARTLTKTAHDFLSFPSFVWYTPFLLGCFFIPDEGRWVSFHWAHQTSSGSHQGQQVFLHGLFFNRHHSSSTFKFVYVTLSDEKLP